MCVDKQVDIVKSDILSFIGHGAVELWIKSNTCIFGGRGWRRHTVLAIRAFNIHSIGTY